MNIIIWVTDRSTGEDKTITIENKGGRTEYLVERWEIEHPEYEVTGWDYEDQK